MAQQSLSSIIGRRQRALLSSWVRDPSVQIQAESPAALGKLIEMEVAPDGELGNVGRRSNRNVVMVTGARGADDSSVWVAAGYKGYRGAYVAFLEKAYGTAVSAGHLRAYDVDHLLNKARSPQATTFIRLEAIASHINQAWGASFEKAASDPSFYANSHRERRTMSWMVAAKLAGQHPPSGPDDTAGVDRIANHFTSLGLSKAEATHGIQSMLNFAYGVRD